MACPPKPVELLQATDTFRPDLHAQRRAAPKSPHPIGPPPPHLAHDESAAWSEFCGHAPGRAAHLER